MRCEEGVGVWGVDGGGEGFCKPGLLGRGGGDGKGV